MLQEIKEACKVNSFMIWKYMPLSWKKGLYCKNYFNCNNFDITWKFYIVLSFRTTQKIEKLLPKFILRYLKKCWCKTSCLGYPQDLPIRCSWFQDGDLLWLQCHTLCIVWLQCFNTGKKLNVKLSLDISLHLWVQLNIR